MRRWIVCFFALPALWIAGSIATDLQAVLMIHAAFVMAMLSAWTAYRSGLGKRGTLAYFLGTVAMMGVAFIVAIATLFTICGRDDC